MKRRILWEYQAKSLEEAKAALKVMRGQAGYIRGTGHLTGNRAVSHHNCPAHVTRQTVLPEGQRYWESE